MNYGNHHLSFKNWIDSRETHDEAGEPCMLCGSPLVYVIVTPTLHKSFEKIPKLWLFWSLAHKELENAKKLVFLVFLLRRRTII
jgi:hypothetical protein